MYLVSRCLHKRDVSFAFFWHDLVVEDRPTLFEFKLLWSGRGAQAERMQLPARIYVICCCIESVTVLKTASELFTWSLSLLVSVSSIILVSCVVS